MDSAIHPATVLPMRFKMAALARALSHATGIEIDVDMLRPILIFCGAGLLFALVIAVYGVDLGAGPF
jgi:hypothetical protein